MSGDDPQSSADVLSEMRTRAARLAEDMTRARASLAAADRLDATARVEAIAAADAVITAVRELLQEKPPTQPTAP